MTIASPQQHIVIVGAGIGGLALTHNLKRYGFSITLLEQADTLSEIGSGIGIWENGLDALDVIGLRPSVEALGMPWSKYEILRPNKRADIKDTTILSKGGVTAPLMIKRGELFSVLKDALPQSTQILTGFKLQHISGHVLTSEDERQMKADVIIGADGTNSVVRKTLTRKTPQFRRQICFRAIASHISAKWMAAEVYDSRTHRTGYFHLPNNQAYWFDIMDSETLNVEFDDIESGLKAMSPVLADLIDKTPKNSILCHPIKDMPPVTIAHKYIALIGDAAHPIQPSLGQGACLALEDAVVLADCLGAQLGPHGGTAERAIKAYVSRRKRRWRLFYKLSLQLGTSALDKGALGRQLAILRMVHTPNWSLSTIGQKMFEFKRER